ncbi:WbqC family protein [Chitinophaga sp. GCM10012297]|uniref:WbqC family protein n=1 Tax=Chitinophaga chungangae TaxID=2821488 RepID=A0ABS3Y9U8_9BACT|nr:WbqC family protein [Chitinophaga chungangae]MBO9151452.1 WbqC family protein [Chitinophaga chungangae]
MTATNNSKILLIESQYFPSVYFYKTLIESEILQIERYEHYQKVSFRNRCYVAGPNGVILLSVPLSKGKNQRTVMKDVRISNVENWQALHWKTLTSAYRRSPWFEYFEPELEELYEKRFEFLLDWNLACLEWVNQALGIHPEVRLTDEFRKTYDPATNVSDKRDHMVPGQLPEEAPVYTQVFGERTGFFPNLSILDLLFCEGKRGLELLK